MATDDNLTIGGADKAQPERVPCEVWTRCVGYLRPTNAFNPGKLQEVQERAMFDVAKVPQASGETEG